MAAHHPKIQMRPIAQDDASLLAGWLSSPRLSSTIPSMDKEHLRDPANWARLVKSSKYKIHLIVVGGKPAGISVFYGIDQKRRSGCTGIAIFETAMQGKGIGIAGKLMQLKMAFDNLGLDELYSFVSQDNKRVLDGLLGLGYREVDRSSDGRTKLVLDRKGWEKIAAKSVRKG